MKGATFIEYTHGPRAFHRSAPPKLTKNQVHRYLHHTKGSVFGIMKSIQQVMTIPEDGIIQQLFGAMTFLLLVRKKTPTRKNLRMVLQLGEEFSYEIEVKDGMYCT